MSTSPDTSELTEMAGNPTLRNFIAEHEHPHERTGRCTEFGCVTLPAVKTDWTREELLAICVRAVVPVNAWSNRDSAGAHEQLGRCWALLSAGAEFTVSVSGNLVTDAKTIWVDIEWPGFTAFECGYNDRSNWEDHTFYLPTPERLDVADGRDWY